MSSLIVCERGATTLSRRYKYDYAARVCKLAPRISTYQVSSFEPRVLRLLGGTMQSRNGARDAVSQSETGTRVRPLWNTLFADRLLVRCTYHEMLK